MVFIEKFWTLVLPENMAGNLKKKINDAIKETYNDMIDNYQNIRDI